MTGGGPHLADIFRACRQAAFLLRADALCIQGIDLQKSDSRVRAGMFQAGEKTSRR
jgi:hypothetical protein